MALTLDSVRVLAVEQYGAGPFGTQFLADQGAELLKKQGFAPSRVASDFCSGPDSDSLGMQPIGPLSGVKLT